MSKKNLIGILGTNAAAPSKTLTMEDMLKMMDALIRPPDEPAPLWRIMASHAVPYGRCFKQYRSDGNLILWANRGEIEDIPRARKPNKSHELGSLLAWGVPIENA